MTAICPFPKEQTGFHPVCFPYINLSVLICAFLVREMKKQHCLQDALSGSIRTAMLQSLPQAKRPPGGNRIQSDAGRDADLRPGRGENHPVKIQMRMREITIRYSRVILAQRRSFSASLEPV